MSSLLHRWLPRTSLLRVDLADGATLVATIGLAIWALSAVVGRSEGIALPLDDAYIHFCYARSFADLTPFVYSASATPSAGATSLLWPLLLAPFQAVLGTGTALSWVAVFLGFASLWGVCRETRRLASYFIDETLAAWVGGLPLLFAANAWFAASGMEVMPLAWLLSYSCRQSLEYRGSSSQLRQLLLLAALCPLLRPEGALLTSWLAWMIWRTTEAQRRYFAALALSFVTLPTLLTWGFTQQLTPTTAIAKWLPLNPYLSGHTFELWLANLRLLFGTLLNGEGWTPMFLPTGCALISGLALASVVFSWIPPSTRRAASALLILAAGIVLPASYETFLVNRLRYIWPFITPWLIGLGIVASVAGSALTRISARLAAWPRYAVLGVFALGLASQLPESIDDLADSAHAIHSQQVSLAHWAKDELPKNAVLGVNDAGALAYFGGHRTFDLVGLTTAGEAAHWRAGPGSRFEHYERLGVERLPTHLIVYPEWLQANLLLGPLLQERFFESTILGGRLMRAHRADYRYLNSAALPAIAEEAAMAELLDIVDVLDVADLASEQAHGYRVLPSTAADNQIFIVDQQADGGRSNRTRERFRMKLGVGCAIILRVHCDSDVTLTVQVGSAAPILLPIPSDRSWTEPMVRVPAELCGGEQVVTVTSPDEEPFSALHYWSIAQ
jgi:hypothetical protein